jgi:hypothetical protein
MEGRGRRSSAVCNRSRSARTPRVHALRTAPVAEQRLSSSTSVTRRRAASTAILVPSRLALQGIALALTSAWFVVNVPHLSLLDLLPFAWTWLTLWLVLAACHLAWKRVAAIGRSRRR